MSNERTIKLRMFRKLGAVLIENGQNFLRHSMGVKVKEVITNKYLRNFMENLGYKSVYLADRKYALTDWETWKRIIKWDFGDKRKYEYDFHDCDNFSSAFSARMSTIYSLNSAGLAKSIAIYSKSSGKKLGYHRANLIVCQDKGGIVAYLYEPMTDEFCKIEKGKDPIIGDWRYKFSWFEFF